MKKKNLISLTVAFAFLALSITGILLFIKQKAHAVEITHTVFGLTFVGFAIFHIINNWSSIVGYSKDRKSGSYQKELLIAGSIFGAVLIGGITEILEPVAEAGKIFAKKRGPKAEQLTFQKIETNKQVEGHPFSILLEKNKDTELPIVTAWTEDSTNTFLENIFVPAKIASMPESEEEAREGNFEISDFKAEVMNTWQSKAKTKSATIEGETPHDNFLISTKTSAKNLFNLYIEVKSAGKSELYHAEINRKKGNVFKLNSKDNSLITNAIVYF